MKPSAIVRCVDVIASRGDSFVVIERLTAPRGLAFPGGKMESGESPFDAASREFQEETGFGLEIDGVVGFYDDEKRDPRGRYVSTVLHGKAFGYPKAEPGKTLVHSMSATEIYSRHREFISDHFRMFTDYMHSKSV